MHIAKKQCYLPADDDGSPSAFSIQKKARNTVDIAMRTPVLCSVAIKEQVNASNY